ncbi:MAG: phosphodiester glycosidase family protein [Clostridiales bacterium]|nr:phosphodiester glycosidase family protein [Clostridiales bacterium]
MSQRRSRRAAHEDWFVRTPLRDPEQSPEEQPLKEEAPVRIEKRYFELPPPPGKGARTRGVRTVFSLLLALLIVRGSAPWGEVPNADSRFREWAARKNEQIVQQLPGDTPAPGTALYEAIAASDPETEAERVRKAQEVARATAAPQAGSVLKHYKPGQLAYHSDKMDVSVEQKKKDGMTYFVCDIRLSDISQLRSAFAGDDFKSGIYEAVSDIAARYSPVLAINADFCRYHRNGVIIRNGELLRKQNITRHHLLIIDENGNMSALTDRSGKQGQVAERLMRENTWQTFEFGPVLVENGEATALPGRFYVNCHDGYYEPRTAIGQMGPLHYIVIVVDGRRDGYSTGASIPQLQKLFLDEGAEFAFNLDGGGSTSLYFLGNVVNMPSGGKERSVSDIILFMANPR